jgi:excisionase family DNA binding protein
MSKKLAAPPRAGRLLTPDEVAELLGMKKKWVYARSREWVKSAGRRGIPTVQLGRYYRYREEAIEAWAEQLERGEAEV